MTTLQVPKVFTHVLRRMQRHPRQPFYELVLQQFGMLAGPSRAGVAAVGEDDPP